MNEPRRLNRSGGISQRLLDSASLDKPSRASRRHATNLAATASAFASSSASPTQLSQRRAKPALLLATWVVVGAAASVTLGLIGSKLFQSEPTPRAAAPLLTAPRAAATSSPDISPEPATPAAPAVKPLNANAIEPWVPSPSALASGAAPTNAPPRPVSSSDEVRQIELARSAITRGDNAAAIAQLNAYDSAHPRGQLCPEAQALRIQALSNSGKTTEARALANEFQRKYPEHPLVGQVSGVSK